MNTLSRMKFVVALLEDKSSGKMLADKKRFMHFEVFTGLAKAIGEVEHLTEHSGKEGQHVAVYSEESGEMILQVRT